VLRSVTLKTIRDAWRGLVWWSCGIAALVVLTNAFYPSIEGNEQYDELLEDYGEAAQAFFGATDLTSPEGYLNSQFFSLTVPILLLIYVVGAGGRAIAGEEEAGTLDLLLAHPVSRTRVVIEKAAATTVQLALLALVVFASIAVTAPLFSLDIGTDRIAAAVVGVFLLSLVFGYLALLVGAATGSRAVAIGVPAALAVAAYLLNGLGQIADVLEPFRVLSPFRHVGDPLVEGAGWGFAVLLVVALVVVASAPLAFARRDVAV
jgi:ABC-2 type transport system permease protein